MPEEVLAETKGDDLNATEQTEKNATTTECQEVVKEVEQTEKNATKTESPEADGGAEIEFPVNIADWLAGRLPEVETLSDAKLELLPAVEGAETRLCRISGNALKVARARVLLDDEIRCGRESAGAAVEASAEVKNDDRPLLVAGRHFDNRNELETHVRDLQTRCTDGQMLGPEDSFLVFHLSTFHPTISKKMTAPVVGFKYGPHENFKMSRCFFIVFADGREEGFSIKKCMEAAAPHDKNTQRKAQKRVREDNEVKDNKEIKDEKREEEPAEKKPRREIIPGCVVIIEGLPKELKYGDLYRKLEEYGRPRFVEFIRDKNNNKVAEDSKAKSDDEAPKEQPGSDTQNEVEAPVKEQTGGAQKVVEENGQADQGDTDAKMEAEDADQGDADAKMETEETKVSDNAAENKAVEGEGDGKKEEAQQNDEQDETKKETCVVEDAVQSATKEDTDECEVDEENVPSRARARYHDADDAQKCADELKEVLGETVTVRVLEGEEETEFWNRLWVNADKAKGKGKNKGKGKDKGKGKGKGKGKDKGKKGKNKNKDR